MVEQNEAAMNLLREAAQGKIDGYNVEMHKGICQTHARLLATAGACAAAYNLSPNDIEYTLYQAWAWYAARSKGDIEEIVEKRGDSAEVKRLLRAYQNSFLLED